MKYSEKLQLLLKGVKMEEIKALEEQEAAEALEAAEKEKEKEKEKQAEEKTALEAAAEMVKDLEEKLASKEDELTKLNKQFADLNNKQTVVEQPEHKDEAADVFRQLYNNQKEE